MLLQDCAHNQYIYLLKICNTVIYNEWHNINILASLSSFIFTHYSRFLSKCGNTVPAAKRPFFDISVEFVRWFVLASPSRSTTFCFSRISFVVVVVLVGSRVLWFGCT